MKRNNDTSNTTDTLFNQNGDLVNLILEIRNTPRALIIRDEHILLIQKEYDNGEVRLAFPGGGQEADETLTQALNRECVEEIGTEVEVGKLLHVADCFKPRDTVPLSTRHLVEFFFECTVSEDYMPCNGYHPDKHQVAVIWKDITELAQEDIFLPTLSRYPDRDKIDNASVYLGKVY